MSGISKTFALFLTLIIAMSSLTLLIVNPANAQTATFTPPPIPTPSIPEFTVQLVGPPYVVNTTYYLDQDTGKIVPEVGFTNQYSYLEITIKNQPFTPFVGDEHGNVVHILYNVRIRQSNETDNWVEVYNPYNGYPIQANSDSYTKLEVPIEGGWDSPLASIAGTQSDIQVEALAGYVHRMVVGFGAPYVFNGTESGWSKTQTVSIPENIPMTTPNSTPTSPAPGTNSNSVTLPLSIFIAIIIAVILLVIALSVLLFARHRKTSCPETMTRLSQGI